MDGFLQDLRYGVRQLGRARGVAAAAVVCIAVGVGANTTIFSLVNALLLRPVAGIEDVEGLVEVGRVERRGVGFDTFSYPNWADLRAHNDVLEEMAGWTFTPVALSGGGDEPEVVLGLSVTPGYFEVLRLRPALGRFFTEAEAPASGAEPLVVISHALWQRRWGGDRDVLGRAVLVNGQPATIVGVGPAEFRGHLGPLQSDVWVPLGMSAPGLPSRQTLDGRRNHFLLSIGRLSPGVTIEQARQAIELTYDRIIADQEGLRQTAGLAPLAPLPAFARGGVALFLTILMVVVGLVLMIACVNVAGMLLARSMTRRREVAIRQSLGASRGRLLRQLLTETLVLFVLGGAAGVLLALWATGLLAAFEPPVPPPYDFGVDLALDLRVLGFTLALTLLTGLLFGLGPALRASRPELVPSLKDETSGGNVRRARMRALLVAGQMALTLLLLVGSGLFLRALANARDVEIGFDPDDVVTMSFDLQLHGYDAAAGRQLVRELRQRLEAHPDVEAASLARLLPLGLPSNISYGGVNVDGFRPPDEYSWDAELNLVSPGYSETLRMRLIGGRGFTERDTAGSTPVAVINETMARHFWPAGDAVGQRFYLGGFENDDVLEVVGVVADAKYSTFAEEPRFFTYLALDQRWSSELSLQVRSRGGIEPAIGAMRSVLRELDPDLPAMEVTPLRDYVEIGLLPQRLAGVVAGMVGIIGLLLASVGIYGVTSYAVNQRLHEIGIRLALGARAGEVCSMVVRQGMMAPALGVAAGLLLALAVTRFLGAFLFGISPLDPLTFGGVLTLLAGVALLANLLPARRAAAVDPMTCLRPQ